MFVYELSGTGFESSCSHLNSSWLIINRDEEIEEIKKNLYDPRNNLFKPGKDHYKPVKIGNAFSRNYIEYKSNGDKDRTLLITNYLGEIKPYLSDVINDY